MDALSPSTVRRPLPIGLITSTLLGAAVQLQASSRTPP
jgi:hypothetical protein